MSLQLESPRTEQRLVEEDSERVEMTWTTPNNIDRAYNPMLSDPGPANQRPPPGLALKDTSAVASVNQATTERSHNKTAQSKRARSSLFRSIQPDRPRNIVLFGETGIGKSSLINMLSGKEVAPVSNDATGCTFEALGHVITIDGTEYHLWDTAGLNEGEAGSVPGDQALLHLRDLVKRLEGGLSLLIYCIRGSRYRDILKANYDLFTQIICEGVIPVVMVVTGLENEEPREKWWVDNNEDFSRRKMVFEGHACITTTRGKKDENGVHVFETEYNESRSEVQKLIEECCPDKAWVVDSELWLDRIADNMADHYERVIRLYNWIKKRLKKIRS